MNEDRLNDLLDEWEELVELGEPIDLKLLCGDTPELLPELSERIKILTSMDQLLSVDATPTGSKTLSALGGNRQLSADEMEFAISRIRAGRYVPVSFLAEGGLGRLFVARDTELNREVVLKLIKNETIVDRETRRRFEFEAEITGRLDHPGIVPVYGFGRDERSDGREFPFYAMRLIRGQRLEDAIRKVHSANHSDAAYNVELQRLLRCFLTVCETIAFAHSRGIIHRDLKPANIMLGEYGETLVVDWGLAKVVAKSESEAIATNENAPAPMATFANLDETRMGTVKGTLAYMSPEQAMGRLDVVGPASDIYSLGAILYIILTGQKAFSDRSESKIHQKVISGEFMPPRQVSKRIPRALEQICLKAMGRQWTTRYSTATEFAHDIEQWMADEPVSAWDEPWYDRLRRWCRRHSTVLISLAVAAMVAIAFLGITTSILQKKNQQLHAASTLAESNFLQANQAVRDIVDMAQSSPQLKRPGMRSTQESLLRVALEYYRDFVKQRSGDSHLQVEMLNARLAIARIVHEIRSPHDARTEYASVRMFLNSLLDQHPNHPEFRQQLAFVYSRIAQIDSELGDIEGSRSHFAVADADYQKLIREFPGNSSLRRSYATAVFLQGEETNDLLLLEKAKELIDTNDSARDSVEEAVLLARICNQMGLLELRRGHLGGGTRLLARAEQLIVKIEEEPSALHSSESNALRASIALNQGRLARLQGDSGAAQAHFETARDRFESLLRQDPEFGEYHLRLSTAYLELGKLSLANGQVETALQQLSSARDELDSQPNTSLKMLDRFELARSSLDLGDAWLKAGNLEQAAESFAQSRQLSESLVEIDPHNPDYHRNLAGVWNQIASVRLRSDDIDAGQAALMKAKEELELIASSPADPPEFRNALAKVYLNLGLLNSSLSQWNVTWQWLKQSSQIFESEALAHLEISNYQSDRIQFLQRLIDVYAELRLQGIDSLSDVGEQAEFRTATLAALDQLEKSAGLSEMQKELKSTLASE